MSAEERSDLIKTRANMAKAVLNTLMAAMQQDCPVTEDVVIETISAATELLNVPA